MAVMPPSPSTQFGAPLFKPDHGHPLPSQCDVFRQQMMMHQRHLALQKQRGLVSKQFGLIAQRDVLSPSSCVHRQKAVGWNRILEAGLDKPGALSEECSSNSITIVDADHAPVEVSVPQHSTDATPASGSIKLSAHPDLLDCIEKLEVEFDSERHRIPEVLDDGGKVDRARAPERGWDLDFADAELPREQKPVRGTWRPWNRQAQRPKHVVDVPTEVGAFDRGLLTPGSTCENLSGWYGEKEIRTPMLSPSRFPGLLD